MKKIIILGAGQVGSTVAASLAFEDNEITVVDTNARLLRNLEEHLDLRTVQGHGAHPDVLRQAGADNADILLAVTNQDETNMVACQIAHTLFHMPTKIARVREQDYLRYPQLFNNDAISVDTTISPEELVTHAIKRLIDYPGALQVLDFADGKVQLVAVKAYEGGALVGHALRDLHKHIPEVETHVVAIYREGQAIIPEGNEIIKPDDEVFFLAATIHIQAVIAELQRREKPVHRIILSGGGNIGVRLAASLEKDYHVKVIEKSSQRSYEISAILTDSIVLEGDAADEDLLQEAQIENADVYCALTNDDQLNILSAMLAKRMGANKVIALINRLAFIDLVESSSIDIAISPQQATIGTLLTRVRRGDVAVVHSLRRGAAEAMEAIAHGDKMTSKVIGRRIDKVKLPKGVTIGAIVRGERVMMPHHHEIIEENDHVILFLVDKTRISEVEALFQVGLNFF